MNGNASISVSFKGIALSAIAFGLIAAAVAVLKFVFHWTFFDALVIPCFLLTGSVMTVQCWNLIFREQTTRPNVRGRWLYGVCAFICVALGALQSEPAALLFFGQFALINLLAFVKPPQRHAIANVESR